MRNLRRRAGKETRLIGRSFIRNHQSKQGVTAPCLLWFLVGDIWRHCLTSKPGLPADTTVSITFLDLTVFPSPEFAPEFSSLIFDG